MSSPQGRTAAITYLIGAILLDQSDKWATQRSRCMTLETISAVQMADELPRVRELVVSSGARR